MTAEVASIESVVVGSEAEALLAEQAFIKQYRPRFNIRLRDDKSYPFIAISLDEDFPRVYFTRERHRRDRAYFGPYSNAKRVRETLELLSRIFLIRSCTGSRAGPAVGLAVPGLPHQPLRGALRRLRLARGVPARASTARSTSSAGATARSSASSRQRMQAAAAAQEFEQAAVERNRLAAVRSLLERQRVAGAAVGTLDAIAVALRRQRRQRPGLPGSRRRALRPPVVLPRQRGASARTSEVLEEFLLQYYENAAAVPALVVVEHPVSAIVDRGAQRAARRARRGARRRARREAADARARGAQRGARARGGPAQGGAPPRAARRGARRAARRALAAGRADADRVLRHLQPRGHAHRRLDGRLRGGRAEALRLPASSASAPSSGSDDFASMAEVLGRRMAAWERQSDTSPHEPGYDRSFAALPNLIVIDGGKGQLSAGLEPLAAARAAGRRRDLARQAPRGGLRPGPQRADRAARTRARSCSCSRGSATRRTASRSPTTASRRDRAMTSSLLDELPGVGPARKRALIAHFGSPDAVLAASAEHLQAVPGVPAKVGRELHAHLHRDVAARDAARRAPVRGARVRCVRDDCADGRDARSAEGSDDHHRLLRGRQVDGDERLRGRRLLLRRQPAAGDDRQPDRAVRPRGLEGRARRGRLRRARRRVLRGARRPCSTTSSGSGSPTACCSSTPRTRRC